MDTPVEAAVKQPITEKDLDPVDMRFAKLWVQRRKAALAETEEQQSKPENRAKDDLRVRFRHCDHYAANNSSASQPSMPSLADSVSSSSIDDASAYPKSSRDSPNRRKVSLCFQDAVAVYLDFSTGKVRTGCANPRAHRRFNGIIGFNGFEGVQGEEMDTVGSRRLALGVRILELTLKHI